MTPALADLATRLADRGSDADPDMFAMILLELAHEGGWIAHPQNAAEWIGQLALEMVRSRAVAK